MACKDEIKSYEEEISKDYRLNYRLRTACEADAKTFCPKMCAASEGLDVCGGKVRARAEEACVQAMVCAARCRSSLVPRVCGVRRP